MVRTPVQFSVYPNYHHSVHPNYRHSFIVHLPEKSSGNTFTTSLSGASPPFSGASFPLTGTLSLDAPPFTGTQSLKHRGFRVLSRKFFWHILFVWRVQFVSCCTCLKHRICTRHSIELDGFQRFLGRTQREATAYSRLHETSRSAPSEIGVVSCKIYCARILVERWVSQSR